MYDAVDSPASGKPSGRLDLAGGAMSVLSPDDGIVHSISHDSAFPAAALGVPVIGTGLPDTRVDASEKRDRLHQESASRPQEDRFLQLIAYSLADTLFHLDAWVRLRRVSQ